MRPLAFVVASVLSATLTSAQAPQPPPPTPAPQAQAPAPSQQQPIFRGGVDLIEVDVGVVDSRGRPMTDLLAPEFTVSVDGKPRKVVSAEFISLRAPALYDRRNAVESSEALVSANTERVRGRLVMIALDRESISFGHGRNATAAARTFLDKLGPNDRVSYLTVPQPGPFVDFTSNHERVRKELERAAGIGRTPKGVLVNIGIEEALVLTRGYDPRLVRELLNRFCGELEPNSGAYLDCVADVTADALSIVQQVEQQAQQSIQTIRTILQALREIEGPKSLVWISEGLIVDGNGSELSGLEGLAAAANTTVHVILLDKSMFDVSEQFRSPTAGKDRDLQVRGLEMLAGFTRGALYRVSSGADFAFDRIEEEISGYYLLGVESLTTDADGKRHNLKVLVRRQNATVRARREFRVPFEARGNLENAEESVTRAMNSPFAVTGLPLRVATYAYKGAGDSKVQVVVVSEIEAAAAADKADLTLGYLVHDRDGNVVLNNVQRATLTRKDGPSGPVLEHLALVTVEPGSYTLKVAAIDAGGRRGSLEHSLQAWQMAGVPFAVSDLMLGEAPARKDEPLQPRVEARLTGDRLGAYIEVYGNEPASLRDLGVRVELAADLSSPALMAVDGSVGQRDANRQVLTAVAPVGGLAPGRYIARAIVTRADQKVWESARPFYVTPSATAAGLAAVTPRMTAAPFQRQDVLTPDVLSASMDALQRGSPGLSATIARVRNGQLTGAARQAFDANDQTASMFLRGLELYSSGDLNRAATQLADVLRVTPDFTPASLYFGACFAAGGRDREAVNAWRKALAGKDRMPVAYALTADALVRLGDTAQLVEFLSRAIADGPQDDGLRRRLGQAYAVSRRHKDAFAAIEPYIARHPADHEALFVALQAIYASELAGEPILVGADRKARTTKYGQAYAAAKGPHADMVARWVTFITAPDDRP